MPKPTHIQKTNQQLLKEIMSFSRFGPLAEVFIMDAVMKMADAVAASTPEEYNANSAVHPQAWIGVAKEVKQKLDQFYGRTPTEHKEAA